MDGMEDKIGSILGNPEMMQKIMAMAQSLNAAPPPSAPPPEKPPEPQGLPSIDLAMIQSLSGLMGKTGIDHDQKALLSALIPYLSKERIHKLENAMRAAKLAGFASMALRQQSMQTPSGR